MLSVAKTIALTMAFIPPTIAKVDIRKRIAIVDTGIVLSPRIAPYICSDGLHDLTGTGIIDRHGHGTNIAGLVVKGLDSSKYCLDIIKYYDGVKETGGPGSADFDIVKLYSTLLIKLRPDYVNMSMEGNGFSAYEYSTLKWLTARGTKVFVAAGNSTTDFKYSKCDVYPACYFMERNNFFVVGGIDLAYSNKNGPVNMLAKGLHQVGIIGRPMSGTSQSTANAINRYLRNLDD